MTSTPIAEYNKKIPKQNLKINRIKEKKIKTLNNQEKIKCEGSAFAVQWFISEDFFFVKSLKSYSKYSTVIIHATENPETENKTIYF